MKSDFTSIWVELLLGTQKKVPTWLTPSLDVLPSFAILGCQERSARYPQLHNRRLRSKKFPSFLPQETSQSALLVLLDKGVPDSLRYRLAPLLYRYAIHPLLRYNLEIWCRRAKDLHLDISRIAHKSSISYTKKSSSYASTLGFFEEKSYPDSALPLPDDWALSYLDSRNEKGLPKSHSSWKKSLRAQYPALFLSAEYSKQESKKRYMQVIKSCQLQKVGHNIVLQCASPTDLPLPPSGFSSLTLLCHELSVYPKAFKNIIFPKDKRLSPLIHHLLIECTNRLGMPSMALAWSMIDLDFFSLHPQDRKRLLELYSAFSASVLPSLPKELFFPYPASYVSRLDLLVGVVELWRNAGQENREEQEELLYDFLHLLVVGCPFSYSQSLLKELKDLEADALFPFPYAPILELFHQIHIFLSQKTS